MRMKAIKSFHTSGLGMQHQGTEFEVHDQLGQEIADKGLAEVIEGSTDTAAGAKQAAPAPKKAPPIPNKAEPGAPANKAAKAPAKAVPAPETPPETL